MWFLPDATVLQAKNRKNQGNLGNEGALSDLALAFGVQWVCQQMGVEGAYPSTFFY
jgi:hypothetical protein